MALSDTATLAVEFRYASNLGVVASSDEATLAALDQANATAGQSYLGLGDKASIAAGNVRDALGNLGDATATTAANLRDDLGRTVNQVGTFFDTNRSKIREFARAGSELSIVAAFLGQDFKQALGPVGEFIRVAGDAGLVLSTVADLGPEVIRGIGGINTAAAAAKVNLLEMATAVRAGGAAATEATTAYEALAAAEKSASVGVVGTVGAIIGVGVASATSAGQVQALKNEYVDWVNAQVHGQSVTDGTGRGLTSIELIINAVSAAIERNHQKWIQHQLDVSAAADADARVNDVLGQLPGHFGEMADASSVAKDYIDAETAAAYASAAGNQVLATSAADAAQGYRLLYDNAYATARLLASLGQGAGAERAVQPGEAVSNPPVEASGSLPGLSTHATARATASAHATKQAYDNLSSTFSDARQKATTFFDSLHQKNLQAIQDALTLARTEHDASTQRIADRLKEQLAENAKPVTAAEKALQDTENAQRLRDLEEAANAAYTTAQQNPTDEGAQRSLRDAREALSNFRAQLNIDNLRDQQNAADAKAQAQATADQKAVDATLTAAEKKAKAETDKENAADKARRAAWTREETELQRHLEKVHATQKTAAAQVEKLWQGVVDDLSGKAKPGQTAIPHITLTVNIPPITLNGRAVSSAISTTANPTQSGSVRTGQSRPVVVRG